MTRRPDFVRVWAQVEDYLVPALALTPTERVVYLHLLRHTRFCGERTVWVSKGAVAQGTHLSVFTARFVMRSLEHKGCLRILDRGAAGYRLELLLPEEIYGHPLAVRRPAAHVARPNFAPGRTVRRKLLEREGGRCFYCTRPLEERDCVVDHVVPLVAGGSHSPGNTVACCFPCNSAKRDLPAADFLQRLHHRGGLSDAELAQRLDALRSVRAGLRGGTSACNGDCGGVE